LTFDASAKPSNIHAQEHPAITNAVTFASPCVKHHKLESNPAQIASDVFRLLFAGSPIHADDELAAVDAVRTCEFEERDDAIKQSA
jgi:hypothetical protein